MSEKSNDKLGYHYAELLVKHGAINKAEHFLFCVLRRYDYGNEKGYSYPSQTALADDCSCNETAIRRQLKKLEKEGLIDIEQTKGNAVKRKSNYDQNLYRFKADYTERFNELKKKPVAVKPKRQRKPSKEKGEKMPVEATPAPKTPAPVDTAPAVKSVSEAKPAQSKPVPVALVTPIAPKAVCPTPEETAKSLFDGILIKSGPSLKDIGQAYGACISDLGEKYGPLSEVCQSLRSKYHGYFNHNFRTPLEIIPVGQEEEDPF